MNCPFRVSWKTPLVELVEGEVVVGVTEAREILLHRRGHGGCRRHGDVARLGVEYAMGSALMGTWTCAVASVASV